MSHTRISSSAVAFVVLSTFVPSSASLHRRSPFELLSSSGQYRGGERSGVREGVWIRGLLNRWTIALAPAGLPFSSCGTSRFGNEVRTSKLADELHVGCAVSLVTSMPSQEALAR